MDEGLRVPMPTRSFARRTLKIRNLNALPSLNCCSSLLEFVAMLDHVFRFRVVDGQVANVLRCCGSNVPSELVFGQRQLSGFRVGNGRTLIGVRGVLIGSDDCNVTMVWNYGLRSAARCVYIFVAVVSRK